MKAWVLGLIIVMLASAVWGASTKSYNWVRPVPSGSSVYNGSDAIKNNTDAIIDYIVIEEGGYIKGNSKLYFSSASSAPYLQSTGGNDLSVNGNDELNIGGNMMYIDSGGDFQTIIQDSTQLNGDLNSTGDGWFLGGDMIIGTRGVTTGNRFVYYSSMYGYDVNVSFGAAGYPYAIFEAYPFCFKASLYGYDKCSFQADPSGMAIASYDNNIGQYKENSLRFTNTTHSFMISHTKKKQLKVSVTDYTQQHQAINYTHTTKTDGVLETTGFECWNASIGTLTVRANITEKADNGTLFNCGVDRSGVWNCV